ncbi:non-SMC mitotic condensation complex subunit 1 domain containing protein [Amanita muscaria]
MNEPTCSRPPAVKEFRAVFSKKKTTSPASMESMMARQTGRQTITRLADGCSTSHSSSAKAASVKSKPSMSPADRAVAQGWRRSESFDRPEDKMFGTARVSESPSMSPIMPQLPAILVGEVMEPIGLDTRKDSEHLKSCRLLPTSKEMPNEHDPESEDIGRLLEGAIEAVAESSDAITDQETLGKCRLCRLKRCLPFHARNFRNILETSKDPNIRSNIVIALGDVAASFSDIVDENSNELYKGLWDKNLVVKTNTLMVLTHLILNGMIKVKGQLGEMAKCLEDEEPRIADLAKLFFDELSTKDNAIYNNPPDCQPLQICLMEHEF